MNELELIGRVEEREILEKALQSNSAEMVAVIGRRRVGKTFLIQSVYEQYIAFFFTGTQHGPLEEQLQNFSYRLQEFIGSPIPLKVPKNWTEAFHLLTTYLKSKVSSEEKIVVFLDELPWIATPKSGFLRALGYFWNSWAVRENIVLVICGSAASWMIQKVVNHTGGLHNRITKRIFLQPFNLAETEAFLQSKHIHFDHYQIAQLYMAMGGVPHYLKEVETGRSATQNIEKICFSKNGMLRDEFSRLYHSLFNHAERHIAVIRALATRRSGLNRSEIAELSGSSNGGGLTTILEELRHSGFIDHYYPFSKSRKAKSGKYYRLTDEYSLFYLKFIEHHVYTGEDTWQHLSQTQTYKSWSGYTFENICLKHVSQIKQALGLAGIHTIPFTFFKKGTATEEGAQIDLLLDRSDRIINLFEIKFYDDEFTMTKEYAAKLRRKANIFRTTTQTKRHLSWVFLSTYGIQKNQYSLGLVDNSIVLADLFLS